MSVRRRLARVYGELVTTPINFSISVMDFLSGEVIERISREAADLQ